MNWDAIRKTNRIRSARKARRERLDAERKARVAAAGGPITVGELKAATRRMDQGTGNRIITCEVWTFRGRDWVLAYSDGETWQAFAPFVTWRMDGHQGEYVPMTAGAKKWLAAELTRQGEE